MKAFWTTYGYFHIFSETQPSHCYRYKHHPKHNISHIFQQQKVIDVTDDQFQLYHHYQTLFFVSRIAIIR